MIKKLLGETSALAWTLGGTALVLITLSGTTRTIGVWISIASLAAHLAGVVLGNDDPEEES